MKTLTLILAFLTVTLLATTQASADVPARVTFTARLINGTTVFEGPVQVSLQLFRSAAGGSSVWNESHATTAAAGLVSLGLGDQDPLDATVIDGSPLFLEVAVDGTTLSPRLSIGSVPYALLAGRAHSATLLGNLAEAQVQRRVTGSCAVGSSIRAIDPAGGAICEADDAGIGAVNAGNGSGITTNTVGSTVTVGTDTSIQRRTAANSLSCPAGQYMRTIAQTGQTTCVPALTCTRAEGAAGAVSTQAVACPAGNIVMGGGCSSPANTQILDSFPQNTTSWFCRTTAGSSIRAIAICCDVTF